MAEDAELVDFCRDEWPRLVGSMSLYIGRRDVAEDVAQETLVRVCQRWSEVRSAGSPSAWAHRVAFNLAKSHARRERTWLRLRHRAMPKGDTRVEPDDAEAVAVRAAVAALPLAQRQALILRYFADLPIREVASVMRCPENTVKTHTRRALESLRASDLHDDEPSSCELEVGVEEAR